MSRTAFLSKHIIELLKKSHLLSATKVINLLANSEKKYNKTSVYRALEKLEIEGKICKESFGESEALYEIREDHHDHAVCTNCDTILKVACHSHFNKKIPGFHADHHHTTIYGLCDNCVKKN